MSTPAGWYDDGHGAQRWWDGNAWTDHVQPPARQTAPDAGGSAPAAQPAAPAPPAGQPAPDGRDPFAAPYAPASAPAAPGFPAAPGYPGGNGYAPEKQPAKKSKLWILWVVLGGVVLLLIVAAAILIPLLIGLFSNAAGGGASNADEQAAVEAVLVYDEAFDEGDCGLYEQATTTFFRDEYGYPACADFEDAANSFDETTDGYEVAITGVSTEADGSIVVTTSETYLSSLDEEGNELDEPVPAEDAFVYTLVDDDGRWAIDDIQ